MGQYYKGDKIGTCESMYYMYLDKALELAKMGAKDDDGVTFKEYTTDNKTMFRFPFMNDDVNDFEMLEKGYILPIGDTEILHGEKYYSNSIENGNNVNIFVPCVHSKEFKEAGLRSSPVGEVYIRIKFEAMRDGERKTIFECARCGSLQRSDEITAEAIRMRAMEHAKRYEPKYDLNGNIISGNLAKHTELMYMIERFK